jgi:voltage-dependent potassium channel beta subunit
MANVVVVAASLSEVFDSCPEIKKKPTLAELLESSLNRSTPKKKVAIVVADAASAALLTQNLQIAQWPALHFDVDSTPSLRQRVAQEFASGRSQVLVLSDSALLAAETAHVLNDKAMLMLINFDFPPSIESYRARLQHVKEGGTMYSFFSSDNRAAYFVVSAIMNAPAAAANAMRTLYSSAPTGLPEDPAVVSWSGSNVQAFMASAGAQSPAKLAPAPLAAEAAPAPASVAAPAAPAAADADGKKVAAARGKQWQRRESAEIEFTKVPEKTSMEYRKVGNSGLRVSALSLGTWTTFKEQLDDDAAFRLIELAMQSGCNTFDTAEIYGNGVAEARLGRCLARGKWKRSDFVVTTKLIKCGTGPNDQGLSRKHVLEGLAASLRRLQLDYVDIVYAHRMDDQTNLRESVMALSAVVEKGMALYWGTSEWSVDALHSARALVMQMNLHMPIVEQAQYNLLVRDKVEHAYAALARSGLGIITWSPLKGSLLTSKWLNGTKTPKETEPQPIVPVTPTTPAKDSSSSTTTSSSSSSSSSSTGNNNSPSGNGNDNPNKKGAKKNNNNNNNNANNNKTKAAESQKVDSKRTVDVKNPEVAQQLQAVAALEQLIVSEKLECTLAQLSIAWCLANTSVSSVTMGASSVAQLTENLGALDVYRRVFDGPQRNAALMKKISSLFAGFDCEADADEPNWSLFATGHNNRHNKKQGGER